MIAEYLDCLKFFGYALQLFYAMVKGSVVVAIAGDFWEKKSNKCLKQIYENIENIYQNK